MAEIRMRVKGQSAVDVPIRSVVKARNFEVTVDEPEAAGGSNQAPTPLEYILSALAGCLNVIAHLSAKDMGIELKSLEVSAVGSYNPEKSKGLETEERSGLQYIKVELKPETDATPEELQAWLEMINRRCPVEDTLKHGTDVTVGLKK